MWPHDEYLDRLTVSSEARFRVAIAEDFLREILGDVSFSNMFIGNGNLDPLGGSSFGGLWYFSERYRIVVANFMLAPAYQIMRAGPVEGLMLQHSNWQPNDASDASVLVVQYTAPFAGSGGMTARGMNCTQLKDVVKEFLAPNISLV